MNAKRPIRLIIVEDLDDVREALVELLDGPAIRIVGAFAAADPALAAVQAGLDFDVGIVDLGLPDRPGVELIAGLRRSRPEVELIVLTVLEDRESLLGAFQAGATGYLLKDTSPDQLTRAVVEATEGGAPMSPRIARHIVATLRSEPPPNPLSPRETEVLQLLAKGATYGEIGGYLGISSTTVHTHIKSIYRKLDVSSKAEATAEAFRLQLMS